MENICKKKYAPFMEEVLQHMMHMPVSGICVLMKLEDGSVCSDYYNSGTIDKMVYAGVIQQDVTWGILKANNAVGRDAAEDNE